MCVIGINPERCVGVLQCQGGVAAGVESKQGALLRLACRAGEDRSAQAVWCGLYNGVSSPPNGCRAPCVGICTPAQCCKLVLWSLRNTIRSGVVVDGVVILCDKPCVMVALWHLGIPRPRTRPFSDDRRALCIARFRWLQPPLHSSISSSRVVADASSASMVETI